jgi:phosphate transport system substrate-binding protein
MHRQVFTFVCWLGCLLLFLPACTQTPTPTTEAIQFSISADTSTAPLVDELAAVYRADRPHVSIRLEHAANAERALQALAVHQTDLVSVSWLPDDTKARDEFWSCPFARDSVVIITHSSNPVAGLTLLQLRSVFQGQILYWSEVGGLALDIIPVSREDGAGTRLSFESLVMGKQNVSTTAVVMPSNRAVVEFVSSTPGAIGYVSSAWLLSSVNLLAVEGVVPSLASVEDGRYLLARPFYLLARTEPSGGLAEFVDWMREGEGQKIINRSYALAP